MASSNQSPLRGGTASSTLSYRRTTGWLAIVFERLAPLVMPLAGVVALFALASWLGFFRSVPDGVRVLGGAAFLIAALGALWPLARMAWPTRRDVDRRIERDNHLQHTPITLADDRLAGNADPIQQRLWQAHRARMAGRVDALEGVQARTAIPERDPWALRALVPLFLIAGFAYSFAPAGGSLGDVFTRHARADATPMRIDAWITPPGYTGIAPIFLTAPINQDRTVFTVPEGSELLVRLAGGSGDEMVVLPGTLVVDETAESDGGEAEERVLSSTASREFRSNLRSGGPAFVTRGETVLAEWQIAVDDDGAPQIRFADEEPLTRAVNGTWTLRYHATDDFRISRAVGVLELADAQPDNARPLYDAPELPLTLPRRGSEDGAARTVRDLTVHPWAGARVELTLQAEDDLEQIGRSETVTTVLPGRTFSNRLARALIEQRRILALDANQASFVADTLDVLTLYPDETIDNATHFLGLVTARSRILQARNDDGLREAVDYLWEVARQIEDGNLSEAERRLRQAQQALRDALENGASDEEIERLTAELRDAMNEFMREMAEQMMRNQQNAQNMPSQEGQQIERQTLDDMLDQIEEMAKSGSRQQAMDMLDQLNQMMNNMQMAQQPGQQGQGQNQAQQQMNELGDILRQQQELMNETFRQNGNPEGGQQQPGQQGGQQQQGQQQGQMPGQQGQQGQDGQQAQRGQGGQGGQGGQQGQQGLQGLAPGQQALQERLDQFMQGLRDMGINPGDAFGEAGESMGRAGEALEGEEGGQALSEQGNALDQLRAGANEMMQQMQQQAQQNGQGGSAQPGGNRNGLDRDPLGRPQRSSGPDFGESVDVPDEIDVRRAREILEAIRKRLGNALSPQLERDYLERLLDLN